MLVLAILSILQFGFIINGSIWYPLSGRGITSEASVSRLDASYNRYEMLREKHEKPEPVWTRAAKQVTEVTEESSKPLIITQDHDQRVVSEPWVKRVFVTPIRNPLILAVNTGTDRLALKIHRKRIIKAETRVVSKLSKGYDAMYKGELGWAEYYLRQAVKEDEKSQSLQKTYYQLNAPVIEFRRINRYKKKYNKLTEWKAWMENMQQDSITKKFKDMLSHRMDMEKKWESGDSRRPDPTDVVIHRDLAASHRKAALENAINALAHETSGRMYLKDKNLPLAYFHWSVATKYYNQAKDEMAPVYGTQYGSIDLKTCNDYDEMAIRLEKLYPLPSQDTAEDGSKVTG